MVDEQRELQMNVGRAMDVLRKDYPYFLKRSPGELMKEESVRFGCVFCRCRWRETSCVIRVCVSVPRNSIVESSF